MTNKKGKKRNYNQRFMQIEQGTFNTLEFSNYSSIGHREWYTWNGMVLQWYREYQAFFSKMSELLAGKRDIHKSVMMQCIRTKLCYALLKSCLFCLRGSHSQKVTLLKSSKILQHNMNYVQ